MMGSCDEDTILKFQMAAIFLLSVSQNIPPPPVSPCMCTCVQAQMAAGTPPHSATSGELHMYQANCMILKHVSE